jgi:hypothetical protein
MSRTVPLDREAIQADTPGTKARFGKRIIMAFGFGICAASGFLLGGFSGLNHPAQYNYSRGACIALEFAEKFGAVGATQKRQAMRAMTTSAGQHYGLFPKTVAEFEDLCIKTWAGEVRLGR